MGIKKPLTEAEKRFIRQNSATMSRADMAKTLHRDPHLVVTLIKEEGLYTLLDAKMERYRKHREAARAILEKWWPTHSASEIAKMFPQYSAYSYQRYAEVFGMKHNPEACERFAKTREARRRKGYYHYMDNMPSDVRKEWNDKFVKSVRHLRKLEDYYKSVGEPQKTRWVKYDLPTRKMVWAKQYLRKKYNYFYDKDDSDDLFSLYYDEDTKRLPDNPKGNRASETYYSKKYGIKFIAAYQNEPDSPEEEPTNYEEDNF